MPLLFVQPRGTRSAAGPSQRLMCGHAPPASIQEVQCAHHAQTKHSIHIGSELKCLAMKSCRLLASSAQPCLAVHTSFMIFADVPQVRKVSIGDTRSNPRLIRQIIGRGQAQCSQTLREMLYRSAPSACR